MGELLRENTRDVDVVIRYGGDEFLIIAPDAGAELDRLKERILNALYVVNQQGGFKKAGCRATLSLGAALWTPESGESPQDVLKRADMLMYEEKPRYQAEARRYFEMDEG